MVLIKVRYPASAKVYLKSQIGIDIGASVRGGESFPDPAGPDGEELMLRLASLKMWVDEVAAECGATAAPPPSIKRE